MRYTNVVLTVIAALLAVIAFQQYQQRPVTTGELRSLLDQNKHDAWEKRRREIPAVVGTVTISGADR